MPHVAHFLVSPPIQPSLQPKLVPSHASPAKHEKHDMEVAFLVSALTLPAHYLLLISSHHPPTFQTRKCAYPAPPLDLNSRPPLPNMRNATSMSCFSCLHPSPLPKHLKHVLCFGWRITTHLSPARDEKHACMGSFLFSVALLGLLFDQTQKIWPYGHIFHVWVPPFCQKWKMCPVWHVFQVLACLHQPPNLRNVTPGHVLLYLAAFFLLFR